MTVSEKRERWELKDLSLGTQRKVQGMMPKGARVDGVEVFEKVQNVGRIRCERTKKYINIFYTYNKTNYRTTIPAFSGGQSGLHKLQSK